MNSPIVFHNHVNHNQQHPDVHQPARQWSEEQTLHVASAYSNPFRWETRRRLANDFRRHMAGQANVILHVAELAYGDRPHEITSPDHPYDIQLRTDCEMWHKENLLNVAASHFPKDWKYGAYLDADVLMTRHDWALEAIHLLQHFDFVQLFRSYDDLSTECVVMRVEASFMHLICRGEDPGDWYRDQRRPKPRKAPGSPGLGWAWRRDAFDHVGGMLDVCILGSGDHHMAYGLTGERSNHGDVRQDGPLHDAIRAWKRRAADLRRGVGVLDNHAVHHWHGSRSRRGYKDRWKILQEHKFNPHTDIVRDWQGVYRWTGNKPKLRDDVRRYFLSRDEDATAFHGSDRELV